MKSTLLDRESSVSTHIQDALKSKWIWLLILFPAAAPVAFYLFQEELAQFTYNALPKESDKGLAFYYDLTRLWFIESLWLTGFLFLALGLFRIAVHNIFPLTNFITRSSAHLILGAICIISFILSLVIAYQTLGRFVNSSDEYVYLFQAKTMSEGQLWEENPAHADFYAFNHIAQKDGKRVGRFPPGWPVMLASAFIIGFPADLVNPILAIISIVVFYSFAQRFYNQQVALWSTFSLVLTGYFLFNAASFFSHVSCMLIAVSFVYSMHLYFTGQKIGYAVLAGLLLGVMVTVRYLTAVIIFLPFFIYAIHLLRLNAWRTFLWMTLGGIFPILLMAWYNYAITGNPLIPVTVWAYDDEALGFIRGHTPLKGLEHVVRWAFMFLYWCSPALLILYVFFLWKKIRSKTDILKHPEAYTYILLVGGYFFYYEIGGNQYGPRFFFEALPFLVLFVVSSLFQYRKRWAYALFLSGFILAIAKIPFIANREHEVVMQRQDIYTQVEERNIRNAVVFIDSHTGVIRTMPPGDLTRNDFTTGSNVLYVHDRGPENAEIMNAYPGRRYFRYHRDPNSVQGELIPLEAK